MTDQLYLASTPLNVLCAVLVASQNTSVTHHLRLIDQAQSQPTLLTSLLAWPNRPFATVELWTTKATGRHKVAQRQQGLATIQQGLESLNIADVFTGNDRRIEFQWTMHCLQQMGLSPQGHYLDDGTYSYIGKTSHWFTDRWFDHWLKRFVYGHWWTTPTTIGASHWIQQVHLAFPDWAVPSLQQKQVHRLPSTGHNRSVDGWLQAWKPHLETSQLGNLDYVIVLPHESLLKKGSKIEEVCLQLNKECEKSGKKLAIKNHPRNSAVQSLLGDLNGVLELPSDVPLELLLANLPTAHLIGDFSTGLLFSKWLQPNNPVTAYCQANNPLSQQLGPMMAALNIEIVYVDAR